MSSILARLRALLAYEPAAVSWALNGGIAIVFAYLLGFTKTEEAAAATIVTGLAAIYTAFRARPVAVPLVVGALTTVVTAAGAFGLHASPQVISVALSVVSGVLALLFRQNLTPAAALKRLPQPSPLAVVRNVPSLDVDEVAAKVAEALLNTPEGPAPAPHP